MQAALDEECCILQGIVVSEWPWGMQNCSGVKGVKTFARELLVLSCASFCSWGERDAGIQGSMACR